MSGKNAKFYRDRAVDEHHRYLAISDAKLSSLPANTKFDCYIIDGKVYELPKNYLVARRLYRFLPTEDSIYVHGGFTPEETLVPLAVYHPSVVAPKPLVLALAGDRRIHIGTRVDLRLEITNLNNYACDDVNIGLVDPNLEATTLIVPSVQQLKRIELPLAVRALRGANVSAKRILVRISYRFLDQPHQHDYELPAEFVAIATSKADLDNL